MKMRSLILASCLLLIANSELYGAFMGDQGQGVTIQAIDPKSGNSTLVYNLDQMAQAQQLSTADTANGIFYILGYNLGLRMPVLVGVDVNKKTKTEVGLPFAESAFVGVGQAAAYDPTTKDVICMGRLSDSPQIHSVISVNPKSGKWRKLADIDPKKADIDVLGGDSAYDWDANNLYVMLGVNVTGRIGIDIMQVGLANGVTKKVQMGTLEMTTMDYDPSEKKLVGLGATMKDSRIDRIINTYSSRTGKFANLGSISPWLVESGGTATWDPKRKYLWGVLSSPSNQNEFHLLEAHVTDQGVNIVSSPKLCDSDPLCPWSLEWI